MRIATSVQCASLILCLFQFLRVQTLLKDGFFGFGRHANSSCLDNTQSEWWFAEEFHSIPYSDIELADQEREERPDGSNIEPIFRDSSLSDLEDNTDVQSAVNYPLGENDSLENPWRMEVRAFQALPFTGTNGLQQDVVVEGIPLDFLNLMMAEEMMESTTCTFLYLSLSLSFSLSFSLSLSLSLPPSLSLSLLPSIPLSLSLSLSLSRSLTRAINQTKRTGKVKRHPLLLHLQERVKS